MIFVILYICTLLLATGTVGCMIKWGFGYQYWVMLALTILCAAAADGMANGYLATIYKWLVG
jgi:hypothetical protein